MAKKAKSKISVGSYIFLALMLAAAVIGLVGLLIPTHFFVAFEKTTNFTLAQLGEYFSKANTLKEVLPTAALTCANIFGWVAVAGAILLVILEALNLFGIKVPSIVKWILIAVTLAAAVAFIVCSATVCVDFYGGKDAYDVAVKAGTQLQLGAGSYMAVIGTAIVPMLAFAKKLTSK